MPRLSLLLRLLLLILRLLPRLRSSCQTCAGYVRRYAPATFPNLLLPCKQRIIGLKLLVPSSRRYASFPRP